MSKKIEDYHDLPNFERKQFPTFVKNYDEEQGLVEHFVAIMGNVDEGGDRIIPGAFAKTISERGRRVKALDQHMTDSVTRIVGKPLSLREVGKNELTQEVLEFAPDAIGGLLVKTQYAIETTRGRDVFRLVKGGFAPESSIGYDPITIEFVEENGPDGKKRVIRELREIRLWEYSNVVFGMNQATSVLSAKAKPAEGKPYDVVQEGDEYCVYRVDDEGHPMGEALGRHATEEEARQQVEALYANEGKTEDKAPMKTPKADDGKGKKSESLSDMVEDIQSAFYHAFGNPYGPSDYWVREVFDDYVIASCDRMPFPYYQIGYSRNESGEIVFAPMGEWVGGDYVFAAGKKSINPISDKAGRVLAARNANRIAEAMRLLHEAMTDAGLMEPMEEEEGKSTAPAKAADNKASSEQDADKAGPDTPPTYTEDERLLKLIQIELETLEV